MKIQVIGLMENRYSKETKDWVGIGENRINNVYEIEFDPLNDEYAFSSSKKTRWLFLNKKWYRISLKSYKECKKKNLIGA